MGRPSRPVSADSRATTSEDFRAADTSGHHGAPRAAPAMSCNICQDFTPGERVAHLGCGHLFRIRELWPKSSQRARANFGRSLANFGLADFGPKSAEIGPILADAAEVVVWTKLVGFGPSSAQILPSPGLRVLCWSSLPQIGHTWSEFDRCRPCLGQIRPMSGQIGVHSEKQAGKANLLFGGARPQSWRAANAGWRLAGGGLVGGAPTMSSATQPPSATAPGTTPRRVPSPRLGNGAQLDRQLRCVRPMKWGAGRRRDCRATPTSLALTRPPSGLHARPLYARPARPRSLMAEHDARARVHAPAGATAGCSLLLGVRPRPIGRGRDDGAPAGPATRRTEANANKTVGNTSALHWPRNGLKV